MTIDFTTIEEKWQRRWADARLYDSNADPSKPHFFMIFAYPGVTGYLHVGHMRGYTISDAICRYKRMNGFNLLSQSARTRLAMVPSHSPRGWRGRTKRPSAS